jgi:hypothetical protein
MSSFALFATPSHTAHGHRLLFTNDALVNRYLSNDANIWKQLSNVVTKQMDSNPVHCIAHLGNFVSIDQFLVSNGTQLLHMISSNRFSMNYCKEMIQKTEKSLIDIYRNALNSSDDVKITLRSCGNIFLCGSEECGSKLTELFGANRINKNTYISGISNEGNKTQAPVDSKGKGRVSTVAEMIKDSNEESYRILSEMSAQQKEIAMLVLGMLLRWVTRKLLIVHSNL